MKIVHLMNQYLEMNEMRKIRLRFLFNCCFLFQSIWNKKIQVDLCRL